MKDSIKQKKCQVPYRLDVQEECVLLLVRAHALDPGLEAGVAVEEVRPRDDDGRAGLAGADVVETGGQTALLLGERAVARVVGVLGAAVEGGLEGNEAERAEGTDL